MNRRRRNLVAAFVAVPTALAVLVSAWRVGEAWRGSVTAADMELAAVLAARWERARAEPDPALESGRVESEAGELRYQHALYSASDPLERMAGSTSLPPRLPAGLGAEVERVDRSFSARLDGRPVSVAPLRDEDGWDLVAVVVVARVQPLPARLPAPLLAWGLLAWALTLTGALGFATLPGGRAITATASFLAIVAFGAYAVREGGGVGALMAAGGAAVAAAVGLSLLATAGQGLRLREALHAWAFLAPSFAHLMLFSIGPIAFCLYLSFHQWNLVEPGRPFVGLGNYQALLGDAEFGRALVNTAIYVLFVPVGMAVGLALALLVNRRFRGVRLLRTVFFLPYITSFVAISLVWKWMYEPEFGLLNNLLGRLGLAGLPWLSSPATAMPSLMLMSIWMYAGYMMVLFLAGLQNIPESLYESARIDGAGAWQRFRHITLPMLRPTTLFILVTMVIFMFQVFTAVYVMTEGGPLHATDVIVYHIYRNAWEYLRMGYASAMAWVLFAIVFIITLGQWRWLGGRHA